MISKLIHKRIGALNSILICMNTKWKNIKNKY